MPGRNTQNKKRIIGLRTSNIEGSAALVASKAKVEEG